MFKGIFNKIYRDKRGKNLFFIDRIRFIDLGFDPEIEKRIYFNFIDLNKT
jgi:hypothetical protein